MLSNKDRYTLEQVTESIDLLAELIAVRLRNGGNPEDLDPQLNKNIGIRASIEFCSGKLKDLNNKKITLNCLA